MYAVCIMYTIYAYVYSSIQNKNSMYRKSLKDINSKLTVITTG